MIFVSFVDLAELLIHNLIVSRFTLLVLLLDIFEVFGEVSPANLVL